MLGLVTLATSVAAVTLADLFTQSTRVAGYAFVSHRVSWRAKVLVALAYFSAGAGAVWTGMSPIGIAWSLAGIFYFGCLAVLVELTVRAFPQGVPSRLALVGMLACLFIAAPALLPYPGSVINQYLGWEMAFSAYSYCVDAPKLGRTTYGSAAFFILVNPVLVYPERGAFTEPPRLSGSAIARVGGGALAIAVHHALRTLLTAFPTFTATLSPLGAYPGFVVFCGLRLIQGYAGHSGRASVDVAMMRMLGHPVAERYRYPLLAQSPLEFWRRWNIYVGNWARRYLFVPSSLWLKRRMKGMRQAATALAVLATFASIGFAHDLIWMTRDADWNYGGVVLFVSHALVLLVWLGVARSGLLRSAGEPLRSSRLLRIGGWIGLLHILLLSVAWKQPAGIQLPAGAP